MIAARRSAPSCILSPARQRQPGERSASTTGLSRSPGAPAASGSRDRVVPLAAGHFFVIRPPFHINEGREPGGASMWKMPVARAPAFLLRRILSCAIAVAVLLSASVQDVHGQGWGLDYVWQLLGYDPPAGNGRWQTVGEQDFDRRVPKGTLPALVYFDAANGCDGADGVFTSLSARRKGTLTLFRVDIA